MHRLLVGLTAADFTGDNFYTQSHKAVKRLLGILDDFKETLQEVYERPGQKTDGIDALRSRQA